MTPLAYILAPFLLALALFVLFLLVSLVLGDPGRPFRMFASRPLDEEPDKPDRSHGENE
jgi:hypothetical protein